MKRLHKDLPDQSILLRILEYEPTTGKLFWRARGHDMFEGLRRTPEHSAANWNSKMAGKEAFTSRQWNGYCQGRVFGKHYKAHRLIWVMVNGSLDGDIDHINGVRDDNRISNLRNVSRRQNLQNTCVRSDNKSGVTGVFRAKGRRSWQAYITTDEGRIYLGSFCNFNDAVACRVAAEAEHGFHPNHGRMNDPTMSHPSDTPT